MSNLMLENLLCALAREQMQEIGVHNYS